MRQLFIYLFIALFSLGLCINEASAKRFGGGRSFGVQRSSSSLFSANKMQNTAALGKKANTNRWGGMLGGLLIGGLLASLFMGNGLANGLMTWLILGSIIFFIVSFMKRRMQPAVQSAQSHAFRQNAFNSFSQSSATSTTSKGTNFSYEPDFVPESFLRNAKKCFIRMQTAYDQKNLNDLQDFTAPEVFAEIKMQLEERDDEPNTTEVMQLEAALLDVVKQSQSVIASVHFTGMIKENGAVTTLDEIWHFRQFEHNKEWVVGGIQQRDLA